MFHANFLSLFHTHTQPYTYTDVCIFIHVCICTRTHRDPCKILHLVSVFIGSAPTAQRAQKDAQDIDVRVSYRSGMTSTHDTDTTTSKANKVMNEAVEEQEVKAPQENKKKNKKKPDKKKHSKKKPNKKDALI